MKKILVAAAVLAATPAAIPVAAAWAAGTAAVPVYPYVITDKPYKVLGEVEAGVRKATVFSKSPSQDKIYGELWERAQKLGADAVVNAKYGDAHVTAFSWGKTNATGTAVKFLPAGDAQPATAAPAQ
nr:heavy metal-binding domain-containing protein [Sphingomonas montanisoli]